MTDARDCLRILQGMMVGVCVLVLVDCYSLIRLRIWGLLEGCICEIRFICFVVRHCLDVCF